MSTETVRTEDFRAIVHAHEGDDVVLALPHSDYRLRLRCAGSRPAVGARVVGRVEAEAQRLHPARGGGLFIEPVAGAPRIVAGTVRALDTAAGRVLLAGVVPMWLTVEPGQDLSVLEPGGLVNGYVREATFSIAGDEA